MRKVECEWLTSEQQQFTLKWYEYAMNVTRGWAAKNGAFWCLDELASVAGLTLVRCVFRYSEKLAMRVNGFSTYLYSSLIKNFRVAVMLARGYKKVGQKGCWENPFNEFEDVEYVCLVDDEKTFAELDFDRVLDSSRLLKESDKRMLRMLFVYDMSMAEVAREFNCSREYVRQKKERALKVLKKVLT